MCFRDDGEVVGYCWYFVQYLKVPRYGAAGSEGHEKSELPMRAPRPFKLWGFAERQIGKKASCGRSWAKYNTVPYTDSTVPTYATPSML